jgi:hypothetical protein
MFQNWAATSVAALFYFSRLPQDGLLLIWSGLNKPHKPQKMILSF